MSKLTITLEPLACQSCFDDIQNNLMTHPGVGEVDANFSANRFIIEFNNKEESAPQLVKIVTDLGYNIATSQIDA